MTARRFVSTVGALLLVALALGLAAPAYAQSPPDLVRLHDGSMFRGTIIEYVPGQGVRLTLPSGEERRFPGDQVEWAGPADRAPRRGSAQDSTPDWIRDTQVGDEDSQEPSAVLAPPTTPGPVPFTAPAPRPSIASPTSGPVLGAPGTVVGRRTVPVHFVSDRPGVRVDMRVGTAVSATMLTPFGGGMPQTYIRRVPTFDQLCMTPCTEEVVEGRFQLGVALGQTGRTRLIRRPVDAHSPTTVRIHWEDRGETRVIGAVLYPLIGVPGTAIAAVGGVSVISRTLGSSSFLPWPDNIALALSGAGIVLVANIVGLAMVLLGDDLGITVDQLEDGASGPTLRF